MSRREQEEVTLACDNHARTNKAGNALMAVGCDDAIADLGGDKGARMRGKRAPLSLPKRPSSGAGRTPNDFGVARNASGSMAARAAAAFGFVPPACFSAASMFSKASAA